MISSLILFLVLRVYVLLKLEIIFDSMSFGYGDINH